MSELFWTIANQSYTTQTASRWYGWFCAAGSLGFMVGGFAVSWLVARSDSLTSLWACVPMILVPGWICRSVRGPAWVRPQPRRDVATAAVNNWTHAWRVIGNSHYLLWMLALIALTQWVITLIDFQFNQVLEHLLPSVDERSIRLGQATSIIAIASLICQSLTGPMLRGVGPARIIIGIPMLLGCTVGGYFLAPGLLTITAMKVWSKSVDYSLFRAAKEILYIPLNYAEKTAGKAIIDMFVYRGAKTVASASLLLMGAVAVPIITGINLFSCVLWTGVAIMVAKRYHDRQKPPAVSYPDALGAPQASSEPAS